MKWTNKGHELDQIGDFISSINKIAIFGAGKNGKTIYNLLKDKIEIVGFIDNDINKKNTIFMDVNVYSSDDFYDVFKNDICIVISNMSYVEQILLQMNKYGYENNKNIFEYGLFVQILMFYKYQKLYSFSGCTLPITERCNLNCKHCSIFTPYIKEPKDKNLNALKNDIDLFFNCFDYVSAINLLGGEPFLHNQITELIDYIGENYSNKLRYITIITNGTIMPSTEQIEIIKKYNVIVNISDYTSALEYLIPKVNQVINCLKTNNIEVNVNKADKWFDFGYQSVDRKTASESDMIYFFDICKMPCRIVSDGNYYYCANTKFAYNAGFVSTDNDGFDLNNSDLTNKKFLLEYENGFCDKGYVELCRKCNGYITINTNCVPVAEQTPRIN